MIKLKTLLPESVLKEAPVGGIGGIGGVAKATLNRKNASDDEPSSASDEFYIWVNYDPLYKKSAQFNCKLENVEFRKEEEKQSTGGGFFKKITGAIAKALGGTSTITCIFSTPRLKDSIGLTLAMKDGKFKAVVTSTAKELQAAVPKEQAPKFIKYLLNQSKWKNDLKEAFPDIEDQLTPESFEAIKL